MQIRLIKLLLQTRIGAFATEDQKQHLAILVKHIEENLPTMLERDIRRIIRELGITDIELKQAFFCPNNDPTNDFAQDTPPSQGAIYLHLEDIDPPRKPHKRMARRCQTAPKDQRLH